MVLDPNKVGDWFLYELFRRLPLKSLFKFKCVSKRWLSLISDPFMGRLYLPRADHVPVYTLLCRHPSLELIVAHPKRFEPINFRLGFVPRAQRFRLLDAHNGLLLSREYSESHNYYVSDPLTARWAALPNPPDPPVVDYPLWNASLIVANSRPLYKVILIHKLGPERVLMDSFDSGTMHWKSSAVPLSFPVGEHDFLPEPGLLYKGSLHWIANMSHKIVAYDPAAHESQGVDYRCRVFDCPPCTPRIGERHGSTILGLSAGGEIRYAELEMFYCFRESLFMCVWILKDYDSAEWCLEHKIYLPDVIYVGFEMIDPNPIVRTSYTLWPLLFDPIDMDVIYFRATLPDMGGLARYNISTATMKMVCTHHLPYSTVVFSFLPWPTLL